MRRWSSDLGLYRLRNSLPERNASGQPVQKCVTEQGEVENSPMAHVFDVSDDEADNQHFVEPGLCQGEGFGEA